MIRALSVQNGHRLELTFDRENAADTAALGVAIEALTRSPYAAVVEQISRQIESIAPFVRFTINTAAAARIEHALRGYRTSGGNYPTLGHHELHQLLCRVLNIRLSVAQLVH